MATEQQPCSSSSSVHLPASSHRASNGQHATAGTACHALRTIRGLLGLAWKWLLSYSSSDGQKPLSQPLQPCCCRKPVGPGQLHIAPGTAASSFYGLGSPLVSASQLARRDPGTSLQASTSSTDSARAGAPAAAISGAGSGSGLLGFLLIHKTDLARVAPTWAARCKDVAGAPQVGTR